MVRNKLSEYLGIPYFSNTAKVKGDNVAVGKGTAKEIALKTIELANNQNLKLLDLTDQQIYNFQKKNHLGIDCSGLVCHLLDLKVDVRKTSADMLTSPPLSHLVTTPQPYDLIRQKNGKHVLLIIDIVDDIIHYIHSSREGRGVRLGQFSLTDPTFKHDGFFRLIVAKNS